MKTLRTFFHLARPFWGDRRNWQAWLMLSAVIGLGLLVVQVNVLINAWSKVFYDTLSALRTDDLYRLMGEYALYIGSYVVIVVYLDWLRKAVVLRWRRAMTASTIGAWMQDQAFYRLGFDGEPDNPDQRIAEDIRLLVDRSVELLVSFIANLAQVGAFLSILWGLSGTQVFTLWGQRFVVEGYLVWIAVIYTLLGTAITHAIGRPLQRLSYEQQHREADFRASLLRRRDHAEQIALYGGEGVEQRHLGERFERIAHNWRRLMDRQRSLSLFTVGYDRVSLIIPVFAALPAFLAKTITLGGLMQIRSAFSAVQNSLSWFIDAYWRLAEWSATVQRLGQFQAAIERSRAGVRPPCCGEALCLSRLDVLRPDGSLMLAGVEAVVEPGEWVRIEGRSGLGKSTLLRTLQGLWPYCRGDWQLPEGRRLLLPQQPYLPSLPLRDLLAYPATELPEDGRLREVLRQVGLPALAPRLEEEREWSRELSGGEQQRLSIARALLYRPDTLYLDEATSQLDEAGACELMALVRQCLPQATLLAVTHQPAVQRLFPRTLVLEAGHLDAARAVAVG
ncbi:ABC transporter ATP-binding protein/permease [Pseudomonas otitidis]|uniref:ABC transporter ATP-binding protein/permease n=1 Tax=Metapseudomonas otitidis TaxID=319939 RepID=A0ABU3XSB6_9GAMM|nr:ABC transporter ATP-binding protein/permease [Pseudomonas otitidis]MDH1106028.1 ABC transporter ATP-binding protein/permease [Pseudomonas otitidis]MDH1161655.1 ABC transporter ATP-binding protein/permease [Pseudomonas otitidis]MDH1167174.1 ABC transporter ATP-binding protein/permease [Pseudomonas otitidis]MDV3440821.1 ABC transporter ATP-binding protein/permease [Pseudomonas otitidis]MEE1894596.1 ABC transporter ATP-binding protein/permease [Pseudomonas otitidis]